MVLPIRHVPATGPTDGIGGGDPVGSHLTMSIVGLAALCKAIQPSRSRALRHRSASRAEGVAKASMVIGGRSLTRRPSRIRLLDRLASAKWVPRSGNSRPPGARPGERSERGGQELRSIYEKSGARPPALIRDPLPDDLVGVSSRQRTLPLSPAKSASGESLVPLWRRLWRSL